MDNNKKVALRLGIAAVAVVAAGLFAWNFGLFEPDLSQSALIVSPATFDFGEISMAKGTVTKTFMLQNDGDDAVKISDVRTSCMCTIAEIDGAMFGMHQNPAVNITIPPKSSKEMNVMFDPNAHGPDAVGPISRVVFIATNSRSTPQVTAKIDGNVIK